MIDKWNTPEEKLIKEIKDNNCRSCRAWVCVGCSIPRVIQTIRRSSNEPCT